MDRTCWYEYAVARRDNPDLVFEGTATPYIGLARDRVSQFPSGVLVSRVAPDGDWQPIDGGGGS